MTNLPLPTRIVVGVTPAQADDVVSTAASMALRMGASLECVLVNPTEQDTVPNGMPAVPVAQALLPPDAENAPEQDVHPAARTEIERILQPFDVSWNIRALGGHPAEVLAAFAEQTDAVMIVIGRHRPGIKSSLAKFINGSVAEHLIARQHRPVLVVPIAPVTMSDPLPWELSEGEDASTTPVNGG